MMGDRAGLIGACVKVSPSLSHQAQVERSWCRRCAYHVGGLARGRRTRDRGRAAPARHGPCWSSHRSLRYSCRGQVEGLSGPVMGQGRPDRQRDDTGVRKRGLERKRELGHEATTGRHGDQPVSRQLRVSPGSRILDAEKKRVGRPPALACDADQSARTTVVGRDLK